ncbi:hypothetical protein Golomagni_06495 [Golovinomyces magnicellulatus]|nr:hypothetical protein Golomagni_06495 [Golovinomyces magnicellulatus]
MLFSLKPVVVLLAAATGISAAPSAASAFGTYDKCLQDVDGIDTNVKDLINELKTYTGTLENTKGPFETLAKIYTALASGVAHAAFLLPMSEAQALNFIEHVNSTLTIDNPIAIDLAIKKRPEFQKTGLDKLMAPAFALLLAGHEAFTAQVGLRIPPQLIPVGLSVTTPISKAITKEMGY